MTLSILAKYNGFFFRSPEDGGGASASPGAGGDSSNASSSSGSAPDGGGSVTPASSGDAPGIPPQQRSAPSSSLSGEVPNEPADDLWQNLGALDDLDIVDLSPSSPSPGSGSGQVPGTVQGQEGVPTPSAAGGAGPVPPASPPATPTGTPPAPAPQGKEGGAQAPSPDQPSLELERGVVTPDSILQAMDSPQGKPQLLDWLSSNVYALTDAEKQALDTDAVGAIPKIMSRVHLETTMNSLKLIRDLIPSMMQKAIREHSDRTNKGREALDAFFGAYPGIQRNAANERLVNQFAKAFRSINPTAPRDAAIKFVGASLHAHLGIAPGAQAPAGNGSGAPKARPFSPARPGGPPRHVSSTPVPESPFEGLGREFDDEE